MQVFMITVLPAHSAQMSILTKNMTMQGREDLPRQNGPQVIPVPKGQGGQVHFIARLHSFSTPMAPTLGVGF